MTALRAAAWSSEQVYLQHSSVNYQVGSRLTRNLFSVTNYNGRQSGGPVAGESRQVAGVAAPVEGFLPHSGDRKQQEGRSGSRKRLQIQQQSTVV